MGALYKNRWKILIGVLFLGVIGSAGGLFLSFVGRKGHLDLLIPMLEKYLEMFGRLRTDRGRDRYPEIIYHR